MKPSLHFLQSFWFNPSRPDKSNIPSEVAHAAFQGFCKFCKGFEGYLFCIVSHPKARLHSIRFSRPAPEPGHPKPLQYAVKQSMKRVPHPVRLCPHNWGAGRLFRTAVPGSNAAASAVCGWLHQERRGNQKTPQPETKAENWAHLYTAKRMIYFFWLAFRRERVKPFLGFGP